MLSFLSGFVRDMSSKVMAFSAAKSTHFSVCIAYDDSTRGCVEENVLFHSNEKKILVSALRFNNLFNILRESYHV